MLVVSVSVSLVLVPVSVASVLVLVLESSVLVVVVPSLGVPGAVLDVLVVVSVWVPVGAGRPPPSSPHAPRVRARPQRAMGSRIRGPGMRRRIAE